jgi:hypothetical protein
MIEAEIDDTAALAVGDEPRTPDTDPVKTGRRFEAGGDGSVGISGKTPVTPAPVRQVYW